MELRRLLLCSAFFVLAVVTSCSEGHSMSRRATEDYPDMFADGAGDDDTQNDGDGDGDEDAEMNGVIVTKGVTYNITIGKTVRLACRISPESPTYVVQWQKDNVTLFMGSLKTVTSERHSIAKKSYDLLISDVSESDIGEYECKLEQSNAQAIKHKLIVHQAPNIISFTASEDGRVLEGSDLLLTCNVEGLPTPTIIWSRSRVGEEKDVGNERLREKDGEFSENSVFIRKVKKEHSGTYYCYALNPHGSSVANLTVTVLGKPHVHLPRTIINSAIKVPAILECSVHEESPITIRWFKDGRPIPSSSQVFDISTEGSRSNLTVTPAFSEDFGNFTCEAENNYGKHSKSITLVQKPIVEGLDVNGAKISWTVHSHQPLEKIEIQLLNDKGEYRTLDVKVPDGPAKKKYEVTYVLDETQLEPGKYTAFVRVKNSNDWSENLNQVPVEIAARPEPVQVASTFNINNGNNGHSLRPTTTSLISTILMYLLVRML